MADLKHPAEYFLRYLLIKEPQLTDADLKKTLQDWSFLAPLDESYFAFLRQRAADGRPEDFDATNRLHRESIQFMRRQEVHELFWPTSASEEAWEILADHHKRGVVEQVLTGRLELKMSANRLNKKYGWFLTAEGMNLYRHFFWNVKLLSFDEWGRFLFNRTALYERHMTLLDAAPQLTLYHLRLDQTVESKQMIQDAQRACYFTLMELAAKPGTRADKVKGLAMMTKAVKECHEALSTSDMALKDVLKQFERFRMEYPQMAPPPIHQLAPGGNFSNSGAELREHVAVEADAETEELS